MQVNKDTVLVGSDFELFLTDSNGKVLSAIPFIRGTKSKPEELPKKGFLLQHDGVLVEGNVPPVSLNDGDEFAANVRYIKEYVEDDLGKDYALICCPTNELDEDQLKDDEAIQMGCDSSYNAWEGGILIDRHGYNGSRLRAAGGHIHFSYENANVETSMELMKVFDLFLAVPFVLIDKDKDRHKLYGQAGEFRIQSYGNAEGFEARTLSNFWVDTEETIDYVFSQLNKMFDYYNNNGVSEVEKNKDKIVKCINSSDESLAKELCEEFNILLPLHLIEYAGA